MKRNKIMSLYFSACAFGTGLFIPFGVLSLLFSFSKRNIAGSGVSTIGKIGKNVLNPTLSNALPAVGLAISALDFLIKDKDSKSKNYSSKTRNLHYNQTFPKTDYSFIENSYKQRESLEDSNRFNNMFPEPPKVNYIQKIIDDRKERERESLEDSNRFNNMFPEPPKVNYIQKIIDDRKERERESLEDSNRFNNMFPEPPKVNYIQKWKW